MRFATRVYTIAGIIGLIEILPMYLSEGMLGRMFPPAIRHPEFYYGFAGVTLAWQVLFLMLARDPLRYRPLMLPTVLEKAGYVVAALVLVAQGRMAVGMLGTVAIDAVLGVLFLAAYLRTGRARAQQSTPEHWPAAQ
ncbi:MAG: hypothetical protein HGA45_23570 [Chloroflexales bacterium]|nr:hypothetical protein [Chloroflexales bacterium]